MEGIDAMKTSSGNILFKILKIWFKIWFNIFTFISEIFIYKPSPSINRGQNNIIALPLGHSIISENEKAVLEMQRDGNLVVYSVPNHLEPHRRPIWSSKTNGIHSRTKDIFKTSITLQRRLWDIHNLKESSIRHS